MKNSIYLLSVLLLNGGSTIRAQTTDQSDSPQVSSSGTIHYRGSTVELSWRRPDAYLGKEVVFSIIVVPKSGGGTLYEGHYTVLRDAAAMVSDEQALTEMRTWTIPRDFPVGAYAIDVVEVPDGDLSGIKWYRSNSIVVAQKPTVTFMRHNDGKDIAVGDSPEFVLAFTGTEPLSVETYLLKDGQVVGLLWWDTDVLQGEKTLLWKYTQYQSEASRFTFPRAGGGYQLLVGVLKEPGRGAYTPGAGVNLGAFGAREMTPLFNIVGALPRVFTERTVLAHQYRIRVVGDPGSMFRLAWSNAIPTRESVLFHEDTISADGVWKHILAWKSDEDLFVFALPWEQSKM
ncbi:MAG: hypothetical protein AAB699_01945 [Patescibacteria group bacterium]